MRGGRSEKSIFSELWGVPRAGSAFGAARAPAGARRGPVVLVARPAVPLARATFSVGPEQSSSWNSQVLEIEFRGELDGKDKKTIVPARIEFVMSWPTRSSTFLNL
ncbi:hypothetical protein EVAR_101752_1 [Eumeta japonica]|uniref:Uncharacterized protein n=1 Tax=Eumeta variegata TaxID=151549 RepID=A0A4C1SMG7_EUMVA|nr:hypothetical protein EVAR_101752_1 [Eumeta japonica]